jgi:hypothetical protein
VKVPEGWTCEIERLNAIALFEEVQEHSSADKALQETEKKINFCLTYLSEYLARWQRSAPYACAWLVYPLSAFDVSDVVITVSEMTPERQVWHSYTTAFAFNYISSLGGPLFWMDEPETSAEVSPIDVSDELLSESLL